MPALPKLTAMRKFLLLTGMTKPARMERVAHRLVKAGRKVGAAKMALKQWAVKRRAAKMGLV
jgi:hypothetical protein